MTQPGIDDRIQIHPDGIYEPPAEAGWNEGALDVDRRHDLSYGEFIREYVRKKKPVVIRNGVSTDSVTPEALRSLAGHRPLASLSGGTGSRFLVRGPASSIEKFRSLTTLGDYLEHFTEPGSELPYLTNLSVSRDVPEAAGAFAAPKYFQPNWNSKWPFSALNFDNRGDAEVFISPPGRSYGVLHYDRHALYLGICQYYGKKLWWMCPPEQSAFLYPVGGGYQNISGVNPLNPDLRKFPLYSQVKPYVVTLEAGDLMFVPSSWWHLTRAITPNISALHRLLNRHNVGAFLWDIRWYFLYDRRLLLGAFKQMFTGK